MESTPVMSKNDVDDATLSEIAGACHISTDQIEDVYACTPIQNSSMAESSIRPGSSVFRFILTLAPSVDIDLFCHALRRVVSLNSVLRTRLVDCRVGLLQVVTTEEHATTRRSEDVEQYLRDDKAQPLNLGAQLFRSAIIGTKLVLTMHHAVMDHSSIPPLFRSVLSLYRGAAPPKGLPFKEFVSYCLDVDETAAKAFWTSRFKGIPTVFPRVEPGYVPLATQRVSQKVTLKQIGNGVLLAHVPSYIESAWALTARAYAGSDSVAFGLVLSGRTSDLAGIETTLGPTIAIFPVQVNLSNSMTVEGLLKDRTTARRQLQTNSALQYGITKISALGEAAKTASGFQTLLNIRPANDTTGAEELSYDYMDEPHGAFGLSLSCDLMGDGVRIEAASDPTIICKSQLQRVVHQFEHALQSLMGSSVQTRLDRLSLLSPQDLSEIHSFNSSVPETIETCVHEIFRAQARKTPDALAVDAHDGTASYRELDEMSDRLAHELRNKSVSAGDPVAFIFEKSMWTVVAVFAIMKAGGACVPIEKNDPQPRKAAIISSAKAKTVLTSSAELENSAGLAPNIFSVGKDTISQLPESDGPPHQGTPSPENLAYIIFTSGSTGAPKGVMLEHRCLASSLTALAARFGWQPGVRMLQFAAHVWDISMGEMFGTLLFGGCLCIPSEEARSSGLANFVTSKNINWAWLTPTVLRTLAPEDMPGLKSLLSIGEAIDAGAAKTWGRSLRLVNGWGPCEASILSASAELKPDSAYPESIGTPLGGALWIVNPRNMNELAPIGAVGELLVEGPGVARGYMNDQLKTKASFIQPPTWVPERNSKTKHLYRTGDLAKYNPDGSIYFVGRQDNQVKIRGQRFELGELESALAGCTELQDVYTTTKISEGRTELVAVVCFVNPNLPKAAVLGEYSGEYAELAADGLRAVRDRLSSKLPSFMVPSIWLAIEKMPRTPSAKLDRTALKDWLKTKSLSAARAALDSQKTAALTAPATTEERFLQSVWASVLSISENLIGRESSFVRLGGDSILAMQVANRCRKGGFQVATASLLQNKPLHVLAKTVAALGEDENTFVSSKAMSRNGHSASVSPETRASILEALNTRIPQFRQANNRLTDEDVDEIFPATDTQAFMLATGETGSKGYYINFSLEFSSGLDTARLRKAYEQVVQHHAILRSLFIQHGVVLYQVSLKDLAAGSIVETRDKPELNMAFGKDATLALLHLEGDDQSCHQICLEIHHVLYDAISLGLVFKDLNAAYKGEALSNGPSFQSWISHVDAMDKSISRNYWSETLKGSSMPYLVSHRPEAAGRGYALDETKHIRMPLQTLAATSGTPSTVMKVAWATLLSSAVESKDVVFGETSANRYLDFEGIGQVRGPCINLLPVRAHTDHSMTLAEMISQVQEQSSSSLPHHHLGFRSILEDCTEWPSGTRLSTAIVYQNHGELGEKVRIGDADCKISNGGKLGDSADIWVIAMPAAGDLNIELRYSSRTLPPKQIDWISRALVIILENLSSNLQQSLGALRSSLRDEVGLYEMPLEAPVLPSTLLNGNAASPCEEAYRIVDEAWNELYLNSRGQNEECSIFECGADSVTALLMAEYFQYHGYDVGTDEIIRNPTRLMQAYLVDSKR